MIIILPYPKSELMPNRKNGRHWAATKSAKDKAFSDAFYATKKVVGATKITKSEIALTITFVQNDKRKRDRDNLLAASKSMLDGMAKAMGVDDNCFEPITIKRQYSNDLSFLMVEANI